MNKKSDHLQAIRPCLESAALCCVFNLISMISPGQSYVPEKTIAKIVVKPVVEMKAFAFHPGEVELLESPFRKAMEADAKYLLMIEPDRLLSQFRSHSGLEPKAERYGGWQSSGAGPVYGIRLVKEVSTPGSRQ